MDNCNFKISAGRKTRLPSRHLGRKPARWAGNPGKRTKRVQNIEQNTNPNNIKHHNSEKMKSPPNVLNTPSVNLRLMMFFMFTGVRGKRSPGNSAPRRLLRSGALYPTQFFVRSPKIRPNMLQSFEQNKKNQNNEIYEKSKCWLKICKFSLFQIVQNYSGGPFFSQTPVWT